MAKVVMKAIDRLCVYLDPALNAEGAAPQAHAPRLVLSAVGTDAEGYPLVDVACYNGDLVHSAYVKPKSTRSCNEFIAKAMAKEPALDAIQIDKALTVFAGEHARLRDQPTPEPTPEEMARRAEEQEKQRQEAEAERARQIAELEERVLPLARDPKLFTLIDGVLGQIIVGEYIGRRTVFLATLARLLDEPVSLVIKGPSGSGKNHIMGQVLRMVPEDDVFDFTTMSDHYLQRTEMDLRHKLVLVLEADGLKDDSMATYAMRTLVSEHRISHATNILVGNDWEATIIEKEGPTGLLTTTIKGTLESQLETRMISAYTNDSSAQTAAINRYKGRRAARTLGPQPDLDLYLDLQRWLALQDVHDAVVPYGEVVAALIPPVAVRARRDFPQFLSLVKACALLHMAQREREDDGAPIATMQDYRIVYTLFHKPFAVAQSGGVTPRQRDLVTHLGRLQSVKPLGVSQTALAESMGLARSTISGHVTTLVEMGFVVNTNAGISGIQALYKIGEPLPAEEQGLPTPDQLQYYLDHPEEVPEAPARDDNADEDPEGWHDV